LKKNLLKQKRRSRNIGWFYFRKLGTFSKKRSKNTLFFYFFFVIEAVDKRRIKQIKVTLE
jgi:CBS domain containing-hemolysin-like protein